MAKITDLAVTDVLTGDEFLPIVQGGQTKRSTLSALRALIVPFLQQWYKGDKGDPGAAGNVADTLERLKDSPITAGTMLAGWDGTGTPMTWRWGDYVGRIDDVNFVASGHVAAFRGAWCRQGAEALAYSRNAPGVPASVQDRLLRDLYISDAPYSVPLDGATDAAAPLQALIDSLDVTGGAGWNLIVPKGRMRLLKNINVPPRVTISGQTHRSAIITLSHASAGFTFDSTQFGGMRGLRIGLDKIAGITAIKMLTSTTDIFGMKFDDLEIVGGAIANQRGFDIAATGHIIVECLYRGILLSEIDLPVRDYDSEGNAWIGCYINNFGYGYGPGKRALDLRTLASKHDFDVRGQPVAGSVAYFQSGAGNYANIVADIKDVAHAIQMPNPANHLTGPGEGSAANISTVRRAENFTPLGSFATGHTVIDNGAHISARALLRGSRPSGAAFVMDGFGINAYAEVLKGDDQGGRFVVHAAGAGMGPSPTVTYFNVDGPYPFAPSTLLIQRNGGDQPLATRTFNRNCDVDGFNFQWDSTPVDGQAYEFDYLVR